MFEVAFDEMFDKGAFFGEIVGRTDSRVEVPGLASVDVLKTELGRYGKHRNNKEDQLFQHGVFHELM